MLNELLIVVVVVCGRFEVYKCYYKCGENKPLLYIQHVQQIH